MFPHALSYPCLSRRRSRSLLRSLFLSRYAQHLRSVQVAREVLRAALALAALGAWAALGLLIAG
jgi:hypothetical protein